MLISEVFKYEKGYWYPHMKPRDVEIWERFIDKFPEMYSSCQYDLEVGTVPEFVKNAETEADRNQASLYKKKIDVVAFTPNRLDLIELKPQADASTIGQLKGYKHLYLRDEKPTQPVGLCIVTDVERADMREMCEAEGVKLFIV